MIKLVNLVQPIPENEKRKIFVDGRKISIFMENWYATVSERTDKTAMAYAEGYKAAYEAMGICLDIINNNDREPLKVIMPFPTKFTYGLVSENRRRTYEIVRKPKDVSPGNQLMLRGESNLCWLVIFCLEACSFIKQVDSEEEAEAYISGFSSGYRETGISIRKIEDRTPLPL